MFDQGFFRTVDHGRVIAEKKAAESGDESQKSDVGFYFWRRRHLFAV